MPEGARVGRPRVPELDGVRGIAVLLVVAAHAGGVHLAGGGAIGVGLFFVLSGYLITRLLLRELAGRGQIDLRRFWERRARRLVPAFLVFTALLTVLLATAGRLDRLWILAALPVADYTAALGVDLYPADHVWSLAVEEQFYLTWPFILAWVSTRRRPLRWVIGAATLMTGWRVGAALAGWNDWVYHSLDGNAYALLFGACLAIAGTRLSGAAGTVALLSVIALAGVPPTGRIWLAVVVPAAAGASAVLIAGARGVPGLAWAPLRLVGRVSYGWYLYHYPVMVLLPEEAHVARWAVAMLTFGLAVLSWRFVEQPVLNGTWLSRRSRVVPSS